MRIDSPTLHIESRSVMDCIDIAFVFYRRHAIRLLALSVGFGVLPTMVTLALSPARIAWWWALSSFLLVSPLLGAAVVAGAGAQVFGEAFTLSSISAQLKGRLSSVARQLVGARVMGVSLGVVSLGTLSLPFAARYGTLPEVLILEREKGVRALRRCEQIGAGALGAGCGRRAFLFGFMLVTGISLFVLLDVVLRASFALPAFVSGTSLPVDPHVLFTIVTHDPHVLATFTAAAWLVYPLARLASLFSYLDRRVTNEGWDVELGCRVEAMKIERSLGATEPGR